MSIRFSENNIRPMGRSAYGVRAIRLRGVDEVIDVQKTDRQYVLTISENGYGKLTSIDEYTLQLRGGSGIKTLNVTSKTGAVAGLKTVDGEEDVVLIDNDGTLIRFSCLQVSIIGRLTQGVKLMRVGEGARVAAVAIVPPTEETEISAEISADISEDEPAQEATEEDDI